MVKDIYNNIYDQANLAYRSRLKANSGIRPNDITQKNHLIRNQVVEQIQRAKEQFNIAQNNNDIILHNPTTDHPNNFNSVMQNILYEQLNKIRNIDRTIQNSISPLGDKISVMEAINNAELLLQTVVAIRDRIVSAYQDILKMPI